MQQTRIGRLLIAALIISSTSAFAISPVDVYGVKLSFSGANQDEKDGVPAINSLKGTANNLINLARGRDVNASVPANEVLAGLMNCSAALSLVVYDTSANTVLATVATPMESGTVGNPKQGLGVVAAQVASSGNSSNGLNGGFLVFTGKVSLDVNGCPTKGSTSVTGLLNITITDDMGTHSVQALVMKGKLSITGKIGTLGL
jgi:hypothetical protein